VTLFDRYQSAMSKSDLPDAWSDLSSDKIPRRLSDLGLVLCEADRVLVCVHCKYSLQPLGQTVSKHLWEKHCLPAKDRAGLNAFVRSLELKDPNALPPCPDGSLTHPHLAVQCGVACLQCRYRTTSPGAVYDNTLSARVRGQVMHVFTNNRTVLVTLRNATRRSGQWIISGILKHVQRLNDSHNRVVSTWAPVSPIFELGQKRIGCYDVLLQDIARHRVS
jgi:hypothetical protein